MNNEITINLDRFFSSVVSSRDSVNELFSFLEKLPNHAILLDFSSIIFVSRSAAHELLKMKNQFEYEFNKIISFVQLNKNIEEMIRLVAANMAIPNRKNQVFNPQKVDFRDLVRS